MMTTIDPAIPRSGRTSAHATSGMPSVGRPPASGPTVVTPWDARSAARLTTIAPITATSAPGIRPVTAFSPTITPMTAVVTATVAQLTSPMSCRVEINTPIVSVNWCPPIVMPSPSGMPSMPPTCPHATWIPTPVRKPMSTVRERKSAMNPSPSSRAMINMPPAIRASRPASATYCDDPVVASPARPAAITTAVAESAPTTRWRDEPKTANTSIGSRIV